MAQRFEGKNLEEALDNAAQMFGVQRFQLTYHVLLEKRGFLGGMKRVVIEAEVNTEAPQAVEVPAARPQERPRRERTQGGGGRGRDRDRGAQRRGNEPRRDRPRRSPERRDGENFVPVEIPPQGPESPNAEIVRGWCERVIALAQLNLELRTEENDAQVIVRLYGRDASRVIEGHGEVIDALQVLANKAMVGRKIEKEIEVDCQQFKGKRVEELEQQAREVADRVRRDHREQLLPAMTPIERRIVHLALQDDQEVATVSRGDGFYKRVAIVPRSSQEPQEQTTAGS
ncbi:MAG: Jag N-terminal domain-containing protein [Acidobacteriota bacterium]|nr:Jag N-terminal domain-containing protein [Acidobacteriota bacterium]